MMYSYALFACFLISKLDVNLSFNMKNMIMKRHSHVKMAADDSNWSPPVVWTAAAKGSFRVKEINRKVEDYMALPASKYSVLSADQIVRLSENEFKCSLPALNFFGTKIAPVLYFTVDVYPEEARADLRVTKAETVGSPTAEMLNGKFAINSVNRVFAGVDDKGQKTLNSDTKLSIEVRIPKSPIPFSVIKSSGNFIIQNSLNIIVPVFLRLLAADFRNWSAGSDERSAVDGSLTVS